MASVRKVILLVEFSNAYSRQFLEGIYQYANLYGHWSFYRDPPYYSKKKVGNSEKIERLKQWGADGVIIRVPQPNDPIIALGLPTVISPTGFKLTHIPSVVTDNEGIANYAAEHLLSRGLKRFAFCGFDNLAWSQEREKAFSRKIMSAGLEIYNYRQPHGKAKCFWENEQAIMSQWLGSLPKPIGVMACNDDRGQQVIEACHIANLRVPDDVAVIGVDNDFLVCNSTNPPLSSVPLNTFRAGYEAAELLDKLMNGEKMKGQQIIDYSRPVATRQSTDILVMKDSEVAKAVRFIFTHARDMIQVEDVVKESTISRRSLQQRFKNVMGCSLYDEIQRVRIDTAARMLAETNLSISQIATNLGYQDCKNFSRFFCKEKNITPLKYRKRYGSK